MNLAWLASTSISTSRQAFGACWWAAPSLISRSSRRSFIPCSSFRRFQSHFNCRRRMERSLATRSSLRARTYNSPSCGSSLTVTPGGASCQGLSKRSFSSLISRPLGVPTRYCTGGSLARISARASSVGIPRSITQILRAFPYCVSVFSMNSRSVVLIRCTAGQDLVGQRKAVRRHDQSDDHLHTVRPLVQAVAKLAFVLSVRGGIALEVGARQIVQQHLEGGVEQVSPSLRQVREQSRLVSQAADRDSHRARVYRATEKSSQQIPHRGLVKPVSREVPLTARSNQPIHRQDRQDLIPASALAARVQPLSIELLQPKLFPQLQRQPARSPIGEADVRTTPSIAAARWTLGPRWRGFDPPGTRPPSGAEDRRRQRLRSTWSMPAPGRR